MSTELLSITDELQSLINSYQLPNPLGFGAHLAPVMVSCKYSEGRWNNPKLEPFKSFEILPSSKILHYGQQIFEGMKAYRHEGGAPLLFRADKNIERFNASARRMAMPVIPEFIFQTCLESLVYHLRDLIPQGVGESLYLRPVMMALDSGLSLAPSENYLFFIIASPSGSYFSADRVHALIERGDCRAAPGGTGCVKTSGNYGGSIKSAIRAREMGFQQTLWLDARHQKYVEEFSGMNVFALIDGELYTPQLNSSILPGVTRDSVITLAKLLNYKVHEVLLDVDELVEDILSGHCSEIFACGTAAIITPVAALAEKDGTLYKLKDHRYTTAERLRACLLDIQRGTGEDPFNWSQAVSKPLKRGPERSVATI